MLLPIEEGQGLARLPAPSAGDVFLDLEGARFARDGGREYLFGLLTLEADGSLTDRSYWAHSDDEERVAFETVVDDILQSWDDESRNAHIPLRPLRTRCIQTSHGALRDA